MKIFIAWSESRSKEMAEALRDWLPDVIQACDPWASSKDISPGMRWNKEIAEKLDQTDFGILCLTPENLNASWIHFEAGALAKKIDKSRVCPYLLGVKPTDIKGPLEVFQYKNADKEGTWDIVKEINLALGEEALSKERLDRAFENNWPGLENTIKRLMQNPQTEKEPNRRPEDMLEEILGVVREQSRILSDIQTSNYKNPIDISELLPKTNR